MEKAKELWGTLSQDEPENQARPATLEQLIVMLTRESARRLVHLINFTTNTFAKLPKYANLHLVFEEKTHSVDEECEICILWNTYDA